MNQSQAKDRDRTGKKGQTNKALFHKRDTVTQSQSKYFGLAVILQILLEVVGKNTFI